MQHFLSVKDVKDINVLVKKALAIKKSRSNDETLLKGKTMVLLFFNPSLRTRLSTIKAAQNVGMNVITMNTREGWQIEFEDGTVMDGNKAEHIKEAARIISLYTDIIGIRTFPTLTNREKDYTEFVLNQFVKNASVPVVNLESATVHPLQSFADLITIIENKKTVRPKVVLTWAPHPKPLPQAVANSFIEWMKLADVDLSVAHPKGYELANAFMQNVNVEYNQMTAFEGADFIYAKNWSAFSDYGKILKPGHDWMVNSEKMARTNDAFFMHCLPVRRNVVVSDQVIDSEYALVVQQAENREYAAQAVLEELLKNNPCK